MTIKRFTDFLIENEGDNRPDPQNLVVIKDEEGECMLLKDTKTGKNWFFYYDHIDNSDFGEPEKIYIGKDEDGDPEYEYDYDNYTPEEKEKLDYIKNNLKKFTIGKGVEGYENGDDLVEVDPMLSHVLLDTYRKFTYKDLNLA